MDQQVISTTIPMLILGLGWTGSFLVELLTSLHITYAATTRDGRNDTIQWALPLNSSDAIDVSLLPYARTVLVTFPVLTSEAMNGLMDAYEKRHGSAQWILLSSTRIFNGNPSDRHGPMDPLKDTSGRMHAEKVVLKRGGTVLHLAGLWGAQRQPRNWVPRFGTEEAIQNKLLNRQLHLIHGWDVARAIVAVHQNLKRGERWIITDGGCNDWIQLILAWGAPEQVETARRLAPETLKTEDSLEQIAEKGDVKPRLDSREFWDAFDLEPTEFLEVPWR
ncbi:hypothetical protein BX666DRAFT_1852354 [Dichotomocladium elegans]|nr:hypothetical protein BX666DRAFT_1852354 [Dichotomocladium elegans]